jgi:hypothetical protein
MRSLLKILARELRHQAPVFAYFFVAFNLLGLTRVLLLREYGIRVSTFVAATLGAFLVSRVVLTAERLPLMTPFREVPVIYNAAWQAMLYEVLALAVQLLRDVLLATVFVRGPVARAAPAAVILDRLASHRFWAIQMWIVLLFLLFCTSRAFFLAIGPDRAREVLLGRHPPGPRRG